MLMAQKKVQSMFPSGPPMFKRITSRSIGKEKVYEGRIEATGEKIIKKK